MTDFKIKCEKKINKRFSKLNEFEFVCFPPIENWKSVSWSSCKQNRYSNGSVYVILRIRLVWIEVSIHGNEFELTQSHDIVIILYNKEELYSWILDWTICQRFHHFLVNYLCLKCSWFLFFFIKGHISDGKSYFWYRIIYLSLVVIYIKISTSISTLWL